jgi:hypothetical protein
MAWRWWQGKLGRKSLLVLTAATTLVTLGLACHETYG